MISHIMQKKQSYNAKKNMTINLFILSNIIKVLLVIQNKGLHEILYSNNLFACEGTLILLNSTRQLIVV